MIDTSGLENILEKLADFNNVIGNFNSESHVNHTLIEGIQVNKFSKPTIRDNGSFENPLSGRVEYNSIIQPRLRGIMNPCVYVFELVSPSPSIVFENYTEYLKDQLNYRCVKRACSAVSKSGFEEWAIHRATLYVGKSEKPVDGRIVVHFGYYEKGVGGLQLVHWADRVPDLILNLHVFELVDPELWRYLEAFEKILFSQLRPILGRR